MPSRRPRVLLVSPPYHSGVVEAAGVWLPLNLVYLAGHARAAGAEVMIYDAMSLFHSHQDIARTMAEFKPDIVATGAITAMEPDCRELCATAKRLDPATVTVMGNVHSTFCWEQLLRDDLNVDLVVRGEGEHTIAELVRAVAAGGGEAAWGKIDGLCYRKGGVPVANAPRRFTQDLDSLVPAWDLVDWKLYWYRPSPAGRLAITSSARGCGQRCSFCSQQKFWERTWRGRDPLRFVKELEHLRDTYGVRVTMLSDETPTSSRPRWEQILDLLIERQVGVESTNQSTLNLYHKDLKVSESKKAIDLINGQDMVSETSFVLGTPEETKESIRKTVELAKWYAPDMAFFLATLAAVGAPGKDVEDHLGAVDDLQLGGIGDRADLGGAQLVVEDEQVRVHLQRPDDEIGKFSLADQKPRVHLGTVLDDRVEDLDARSAAEFP
jgi:anaerobic magnesium-protoporphyrin IX monomethyl ester cyclase